MNREKLYSYIVKPAIVPVAASADITGVTIDRKGYDSVDFHVLYGIEGGTIDADNYWAAHLEESDDDSTWTDVAITDLIPVGDAKEFAIANAIAETPNSQSFCRAYNGTKRYVRIMLDELGSGSSITAHPLCAFAVMFALRQPVAVTPALT